MKGKWVTIGFCFALLWASASAATKIALLDAQPFVIAVSRFFIAGGLMLFFAHGIKKYRLPQKREWKQVMLYGLMNISIYLGLYVMAMQKISAGLGTLAVGMNPVIISMMAAAIFKKPVGLKDIISLLICLLGVFIAAYPLLKTSYASLDGIIIILVSMLAYSAAAIYYSYVEWNGLKIVTINGWQTIFGGLFLLPILFFTYKEGLNHYTHNFWVGTLWLAIPVSIGAVQCWLYLSRQNASNASYWLFLCPVFGFLLSAALLKEPLSWYTAVGVMLVLIGLYSRNSNKNYKVEVKNRKI
ncbi:MAG: EamA family transporter [Chitinophagaceae bacterium]|nr:MAG: EamA family transporter [Chitinophagaceae bacterium]